MILKKYYLGTFTASLILFTVMVLTTKSPNTPMENALIVIAGALLMSFLVGTLYYLQDTRWGPAKRRKRLFNKPFEQLRQQGFRIIDDGLVGEVNNYTTIVTYAWPGGRSAVRIELLFDAATPNGFISAEDMAQIEKRNKQSGLFADNGHEWSRNTLGYNIEYNFYPPTPEKVLQKANELAAMLSKEGLRPIGFDESRALFAEIHKSL